MAVYSIRQMPRPILISLTPSGHGSIAIDLRHYTYVWDTDLEEFPSAPAEVVLGTYPIAGDSPGLGGRVLGLDPLLWMIGLHAFPDGRASWLRPDDKYRLKWWPDLDVMPHTPEQARTVKILARSLMTVEKLAKLVGSTPREAQQVVNALSLMGALRRVESSNAVPMLPPVPPELEPPTLERGKHVRRGG